MVNQTLLFSLFHNKGTLNESERDKSKSNKRTYFFMNHIISLWNTLPQDTAEAESSPRFILTFTLHLLLALEDPQILNLEVLASTYCVCTEELL